MNLKDLAGRKLSTIRLRNWLLALAPAVIIAWVITGRLGVSTTDEPDTPMEIAGQTPYEAFGRGIRSHIFDASGELTYEISAESQRMYPDQVSELDIPIIRMYEANQERWNISALSGRIRATSGGSIQQLELEQGVQIRHELNGTDSVRLTTDWIVVDADTQRLHTDAVVNVSGSSITQQAVGMRADLSSDSLEFLSNVNGRFSNISPP
ncbi:LPS export ABC transporter periplasmic protein LptC [Pseudohongiella spirulinae]|uniref:LPS export ABC transporter periplasmic protein LptC n=1 Tax=Pseudohongiella spirulinae TaxID=1249552 RepID=UPI000717643D|nr:LPS export ABC transporter periplasmic protein LptC [Pseudohongiella spirulinae]